MTARTLSTAYHRMGTAADLLAVAVMLTWLLLAAGPLGSPII